MAADGDEEAPRTPSRLAFAVSDTAVVSLQSERGVWCVVRLLHRSWRAGRGLSRLSRVGPAPGARPFAFCARARPALARRALLGYTFELYSINTPDDICVYRHTTSHLH